MNLLASSIFLMGILCEIGPCVCDKPILVEAYPPIASDNAELNGAIIKGVDLSNMDVRAIEIAYCEQGNTQVKNFLGITANPLSGVGKIGIFKVMKNLEDDIEFVIGCECVAVPRPFLLRTDDLQAGPISVYLLKEADAEV